ncbi:hypothetical protein Unana1_02794 [Umbelopsis nana]
MRLTWYLRYGIGLSLTAAGLLLLATATESAHFPSPNIDRFDLDTETLTYRHVQPGKSNIKKRSNTLPSRHDFLIRTNHQSYNVQAAGRLLVGISSSFAQPAATSLSTAMPPSQTATVQATVPLAPPTVTTALSNDTGTNIITSLTSEIEVRLKCNIDATYCAKVANAFGSAIIQLGQVLRVKNRIIFCNNQCANTTYGWALPSSQYTLPNLNGVDPNYLYPQALAKQLSPYNSTQWSTTDGQNADISAEFNHDAYLGGTNATVAQGWNGTGVMPGGRFWFQGDPAIRSDQIDMEYIILHELVHGLGFISSWGTYFLGQDSPYFPSVQNLVNPTSLQIATLTPNSYTDSKTGAVYLTGFLPGMIFDKYLIANTAQSQHPQSLAVIGDKTQNFCLQNDDAYVVNFINQFNKSNYSSDAQYVFQLLNSNQSLAFNLSSQLQNNLYTTNLQPLIPSNLALYSTNNASNMETSRGNFRPGLIVSHFDDSYLTTPNFLMCRSYQSGITLQGLTSQVYSTATPYYYNTTLNGTTVQSIYNYTIGPGILNILNAIGYGSVTNNVTYPAVFSSDKQFEPKKRSGCDTLGLSGSPQSSTGMASQSSTLLANLEYTSTAMLLTFFLSAFSFYSF